MKITRANLEFIRNDVYLNMTALVPTQNYNSWYLKKNKNTISDEQDRILDFTLYSDQDIVSDKLFFKTKTIRQKVSMNKRFNGLKLNVIGGNEVIRLHKICRKQDPIGSDEFDFEIIGLEDKTLHIVTRYMGGLSPHAFQLNWDGYVKYNGVIQVTLGLSHNSYNDSGVENKQERLQFDLSGLFLLEEKLRIIVKSDRKIGIITHNP